jgi:hypothetical protein
MSSLYREGLAPTGCLLNITNDFAYPRNTYISFLNPVPPLSNSAHEIHSHRTRTAKKSSLRNSEIPNLRTARVNQQRADSCVKSTYRERERRLSPLPLLKTIAGDHISLAHRNVSKHVHALFSHPHQPRPPSQPINTNHNGNFPISVFHPDRLANHSPISPVPRLSPGPSGQISPENSQTRASYTPSPSQISSLGQP